MEDVQAHSSFQHLDKVCLQLTVVRHFLVFMLHEIQSVDKSGDCSYFSYLHS